MYVNEGKVIDWTNGTGTDVEYNDVVSMGTRIGIAGEAIANGDTGSVAVVGVHELKAENDTAFAVGDALYWDPVAKELTKTSTNNIPAGWAVTAKAQTTALAKVKIG